MVIYLLSHLSIYNLESIKQVRAANQIISCFEVYLSKVIFSKGINIRINHINI